MTISVRNAGVFSEAAPSVRAGGVWQALTEGYVRVAGVWARFYTAVTVSISNVIAPSLGVWPSSVATAVYQLESDGDIGATDGFSLQDVGDWITPKLNMSSYECRATLTSGSLSTGITGAWLSLSATRSWTLTRSSIGSSEAYITVEIRRASDAQVLSSATINLLATVIPS